MEFKHKSVMLDETIKSLNINPDGIYLDGTVGGAGHSKEIAKKLNNGKLICLDQDDDAIKKATEELSEFKDKVIIRKSNFKDFDNVLDEIGIEKLDGALLDLGVSSYQLDDGERGFSFHQDYPLDMRMDRKNPLDAKRIVNTYSQKDLERILYEYGEESWAKRISEFIVEERKNKEIETTFDLVEIIKKAIPKAMRMDSHPATKTFQAIRIEVNNELGIIEDTIKKLSNRMNKGGIIAIITFHSLEDRIVKNTFKYLEQDCICDPKAPICTCDKKRELKIITRKPILPTDEEVEENRRSRSAKLRVAKKV